jgi:hypothetical protein
MLLPQRLNIVVPYRNREAHLAQFIPHVADYMARVHPDLSYRVTVAEQDQDGLPFNRGALKNIGFLLGEADSDYVCLHDVDYLPEDADYRYADDPTAILWHGAEARPIAPDISDRVIRNDLESTFGGALLVPNRIMRRIDGYSNLYWGWGFEDFDFSLRIRARNIATGRRRGSFTPLDHDNEGFNLDATPSPIAVVNRGVFQKAWSTGKIPAGDGLSGLNFEVLERKIIHHDPRPHAGPWVQARIRLNAAPSPEQAAALPPGRE